ncbi:MAG: L-fucose/L-arabinose isomerase family protein [Kiritimatiellia bacterium]|nr:L-fucose/L-arabinose isomerase family protein [Kiritimatiellia bacterium]
MKVQRRKPLSARVGIVGVGHHVYWPQFEGLLDEMHRKMDLLTARVKATGVQVFTYGLVDNAASTYAAVPRMQADDLDLLFVDMVTYATSATFGILARDIRCPIVLVALQPLQALDYAACTTYKQLVNDDLCSVPEFTGVAIRMGRRPPPLILGHEVGDTAAEKDLQEWCRVACVLHDLRKARLGLMGHVLESMLDMHADPTAVTAAFGAHIALVEPDDLMRHYRDLNPELVTRKKQEILSFFDTPDPKVDPITGKLTDKDLEVAARVAVALDALIEERKLDGLAYYYEGEPGSPIRELVTNLIVGNSLLTGAGFPMCGEFDIKTCVAMMILDRLDIGGSFAEFHPIDFAQDTVLVGHDGPHHINIASERPVLRSLKKYHGKPGSGAGVEFRIRPGPITMLSIGVNAAGKFKFVVAEGESLDRPIPATGNTNTHGQFRPDVRTFLKRWVNAGPTHHFALGIGHHARAILRVAECLGIECEMTTPESE